MRCAFTKPDGKKCNANALRGDKLCFSHSPKTREALLVATRKGGRAPRKSREPLPPLQLKDMGDAITLLADTINGVRQGTVELRVANCTGYLSGHLIKALEASELAELEKRITTLEKAVGEHD